jgi:mlo protein
LSNGTQRGRALRLKPSKEHFWFGRPELVLHLIHFILFQNSFEIGFFFWVVVMSITSSHLT